MSYRDPVKQRECERRYREAHRAELNAQAKARRDANRDKINARRRENYGSRREYFREYYVAKKAEYYNPCPDCGRPKSRRAKRCELCAIAARTRGRPIGVKARSVAPRTTCPYCDSELRLMVWHEQSFKRCPGCGLETTDEELKRMAFEEAA